VSFPIGRLKEEFSEVRWKDNLLKSNIYPQIKFLFWNSVPSKKYLGKLFLLLFNENETAHQGSLFDTAARKLTAKFNT
jgi:hypothetical protein